MADRSDTREVRDECWALELSCEEILALEAERVNLREAIQHVADLPGTPYVIKAYLRAALVSEAGA